MHVSPCWEAVVICSFFHSGSSNPYENRGRNVLFLGQGAPPPLIVKSLGDAPEIFILFEECPASRSDSPSIDESTDDLPSIRLLNQPVTPQERP
ncbi:hypothetical protein AVEN_18743-1 [Araneus ventricosus]|uniref:Uncharacterized protein n=1 Tax=Araneus ventricosus TaxID=182803 RepID=A0A4Y2GK64_ARAVE|nr:hypothetical protein AVEN_18743-1 [Araneus ventricosus]